MTEAATQEGVAQTESSVDSDADLLSRLKSYANIQDAPAEPPVEAREPEQSDAQAEPEPETPAVQTVRVKVDGAEREVPIDEVVATYQKTSAADKRLQEAAMRQREVETVWSKLNEERQHQMQVLNTFIERAQQFGPKAPDIALLDSDPLEYLKQEAAFKATHAQLQEAAQQRAYLEQQQHAEFSAQQTQRLQTERDALLKALPHWSDESKAKADKERVSGYLRSIGVDEQTIGSVSDHRLVVMAREAALYRELMSKAKEAPKAVAKAPARVERPGVAGSALDGRTAAMQRLSRSGKAEDAAAVFKSLLDSQ